MRHLHVVPPGGQGTDPPKRRKYTRSSALLLTHDERRHLRVALHNLRRSLGTWPKVATALGVSQSVVAQSACKNAFKGSAVLAVRVAHASGLSVEAVLSGTIGEAGRCTSC